MENVAVPSIKRISGLELMYGIYRKSSGREKCSLLILGMVQCVAVVNQDDIRDTCPSSLVGAFSAHIFSPEIQ